MVDPKIMCRKHLLGEHLECHMFIGTIKKGRSLSGFINNNLLQVHSIVERHDELVIEMERRGYNHKTPLFYNDLWEEGYIDTNKSLEQLLLRCEECSIRWQKEN